MKTEMKQIRFQNARGSFAELQHFHSMAVRGIGVLVDVSGGLFGGKGRPDAAVVARLSGQRTDTVFPAAA